MNSFCDVAVAAAKKAGDIHRHYFSKGVSFEEKSASYDRVTVADVESEEAIVKAIHAVYPDHNILAEEAVYSKTDSPYTWIIDPLDGTNNFSHGLPIFSVSIALAHHDELIAGVVYDVSREELFVAEKGKGATFNGASIHVSKVAKLSEAILITGFYYDRGEQMVQNLEKMRAFFEEQVVGIRRLGAATLDLCYVAMGRVSGYWEFKLAPWDFAAGSLIVEEAGGQISNRTGNSINPFEPSFMVCSNKHLHQPMLDVIQK